MALRFKSKVRGYTVEIRTDDKKIFRKDEDGKWLDETSTYVTSYNETQNLETLSRQLPLIEEINLTKC